MRRGFAGAVPRAAKRGVTDLSGADLDGKIVLVRADLNVRWVLVLLCGWINAMGSCGLYAKAQRWERP